MLTWLNDNSGAVQALTTTVLVVITVYNVWMTRVMARATVNMAEAGERLRLDSARPVTAFRLDVVESKGSWVFRIEGAPSTDRFILELVNAGVGPALDLDVEIRDSLLRYFRKRSPAFPLALGVGEAIQVEYALHNRAPFRDETDPLRWPRNDDDVALEQRRNNPGTGREGVDQFHADDAELIRRQNEFHRDVRSRIAPLATTGTVVATYRDVYGRTFTSRAALNTVQFKPVDPRSDAPVDYWRRVELGPLSLTRVDQ